MNNNNDKVEENQPQTNGGRAEGNRPNAQSPANHWQFDWVTERSSCSLPKVFNDLRLQVENDVKTRNSLRPKFSRYEFSMTEDTSKFSVLLQADELQKSVTFNLGDHLISVTDDQGKTVFEVSLSFDERGRCRSIVNAQECEFWQIRRMALEDLMFRGL